jgi:DNA-binding response OmpR family regulator
VNILLVEPDRILGEATKVALEAAGYSVVRKRSAQTALDTLDDSLASGLPGLIILELQLGIHNGVEFLYEVNSYPEWQHIPIIVHTINAKAQDEIFSEPLSQLKVKAVLYKPRTTTAKLMKVVKQLEAI